MDDDVYNVEKIVGRKCVDGIYYYKVRWEGYSKDDDTWEPEENIIHKTLIANFEKREKERTEREKASKKRTRSETSASSKKRKRRNTPSSEEEETNNVSDVEYESDFADYALDEALEKRERITLDRKAREQKRKEREYAKLTSAEYFDEEDEFPDAPPKRVRERESPEPKRRRTHSRRSTTSQSISYQPRSPVKPSSRSRAAPRSHPRVPVPPEPSIPKHMISRSLLEEPPRKMYRPFPKESLNKEPVRKVIPNPELRLNGSDPKPPNRFIPHTTRNHIPVSRTKLLDLPMRPR